MKKFIIKNLLSIKCGTMGQKLAGAFWLSLFPAVGVSLLEKTTQWYIGNQVFITLLGGAITTDLILGVWKHAKFHTFSFKKLITGFIEKAWIIILAYFLSESLVQIISETDFGAVYFKAISRLMLFIYPAGNAFVNMGIITSGEFPPAGLLKRFEKFNNNFDLNAFRDENNNNDNCANNTSK